MRVYTVTAPRLDTVNGETVVLKVKTDLRRGARATVQGPGELIAAATRNGEAMEMHDTGPYSGRET